MTATEALKLLVVLSLPNLMLSFQPLFSGGKSVSHRDITQRAILRKTAEVCRDISASLGWEFSLTIDDDLSADAVQAACSSPGVSKPLVSSVSFHAAIATMYLSNGMVDVVFLLSAPRHFDDETFHDGRDIITKGVAAVKADAKRENFLTGRWTLGRVFHTLQDFYSHSNWVEMGRADPYSALIRPDQPLEKLAGPTTPTCRMCPDGNCNDNLLPEVLQQGLLTSGYFNIFWSSKPAGKCSHGGSFDRTSRKDPVGGINKDTAGSSHGSLHHQAAALAVSATVELLQDIRVAAGDKTFLRLMGLTYSSALCFVIDTTGSMSNEITDIKRVSSKIIDNKRGTQQEPSAYILVPFNDPKAGPVIKTTDADVFKNSIDKLSASEEGDIPEMSLSGLQLALTAAPPSSEIFVFTDAPAKDALLSSTIMALIESTKSVVTFMLTDVLASQRRRRRFVDTRSTTMDPSDVQVYRDLAQVSGGQTIEVSESALAQATTVIEDSSIGVVVTVFQAVMNPGRPELFTFTVDSSLRNMIVYITGPSNLTFSVTSPTGVSQRSSKTSGPLASIMTAGNLHRLNLSTESQTGSWQISVESQAPYSIKVTGQSSLNFIYNLVEEHEGGHGDFSLMDGRPLSGSNVSLLVTVTGSDKVKVTEVTLFDSSGSADVNGSLQSIGAGDLLVTFNSIPAGDFVVCLKGEETSSASTAPPVRFQRQASTQIQTSNISVTVQAIEFNIEPGSTIFIPLSVASTSNGVLNKHATELFRVRANNDRGYSSTWPSTVTVAAASGGIANGTISLNVPASAASGTDVTLTIVVENEPGTDINYSVLRFSVAAMVTDISHPVCQVVNMSGGCPSSPSLCLSSQWGFIANITDGVNGTGLESVTVRRGSGTLTTSTVAGTVGENVTVATYSASCCSQNVELAIVDRVGNVGACVRQAAVNTASTRGNTLSLSNMFLIITVAFFLCR